MGWAEPPALSRTDPVSEETVSVSYLLRPASLTFPQTTPSPILWQLPAEKRNQFFFLSQDFSGLHVQLPTLP